MSVSDVIGWDKMEEKELDKAGVGEGERQSRATQEL
jgi:hypothetical protein